MTITLNIKNEQLFDKILQLLNRFTNDGLEIVTNRTSRGNNQKNLPKGFLNPIPIDSYSNILSRDESHER